MGAGSNREESVTILWTRPDCVSPHDALAWFAKGVGPGEATEVYVTGIR